MAGLPESNIYRKEKQDDISAILECPCMLTLTIPMIALQHIPIEIEH